MVDFTVRGKRSKLKITIGGVGGKQAELTRALQDCAEGRCTCPTSQYEKLQSVEISGDPNNVYVTLTPKAGEVIDRNAIDKCLEYTAKQVASQDA